MKKLILTIVLILGLLPYLHNSRLSLAIEKAAAQSFGVEEDNDGNYYLSITDGPLPDGTSFDAQEHPSMCLFKCLEVIGNYYGEYTHNQDWYAQNYSDNYTDIGITAVENTDGVDPIDIGAFVSDFFTIWNISDDYELLEDYDEGNTILGFKEGSDMAHACVIVSVDIEGGVEYFDPGDGLYKSGTAADFVVLTEVTPK